jgi:hypothetical protein
MCIISLSVLNIFFAMILTLLFHMFMSFFSLLPQDGMFAPSYYFAANFLFARIVDLRPVVIDIYIYWHTCIQYVHLFFLFFLRVIWEKSEWMCMRTVDSSVCVSDHSVHSLLFFLSLDRDKHTKKKTRKKENSWPVLYMCMYFIWIYCHFRHALDKELLCCTI